MLEMTPNTPPVGLVGVIPGPDGVAGVAVVPLVRRDADVVHFHRRLWLVRSGASGRRAGNRALGAPTVRPT